MAGNTRTEITFDITLYKRQHTVALMNTHTMYSMLQRHYHMVLMIGLFVAFAVLSGCASMSKAECTAADWKMVGLVDGSSGRALTYINRHRKACAKINVTPSLSQYEQGHAQGLDYYCIFDKGFRLGSLGLSYNAVCPAQQRQSFALGYNKGREQYLAQKDIHNSDEILNDIEGQISEIYARITVSKNVIEHSDTTPKQRRLERKHIKELRYELSVLKAQYVDEEAIRQEYVDFYHQLLQQE